MVREAIPFSGSATDIFIKNVIYLIIIISRSAIVFFHARFIKKSYLDIRQYDESERIRIILIYNNSENSANLFAGFYN
jgi:hypothetical protein